VTGIRRAMVTGGAGFVGSTLVDRLLAEGWEVTAYDNFDGFYAREQKRRNLSGALSSDRFALVEGDTRDPDGLRTVLDRSAPDVVFDLAARAGVRPSIDDPLGYIDVNVRGVQTLLEALAGFETRIVFASSSSIYGNDDRQPFAEDQARGRPESPYGASKVAAEALLHAHHAVTGRRVSVARLFTVYGPRQRPDLAIHKFARHILSGREIELYDEGRGVRDYTFVDDVVDALIRLADAPDPYLIVNVGSQAPVETRAVVDELERVLGVPAKRTYLPAQLGDVTATFADITRARERLGWEPRTSFPRGIEAFAAWLRHDRQEVGDQARPAVAPSASGPAPTEE
jgi:UDP-glucuronate 4-epimerase